MAKESIMTVLTMWSLNTVNGVVNLWQEEELVSVAIKNLPSNSAAVLQCAMVYIYELREADKGFQLIRAGIDDPQASDRDVLFMAAANLLPYAKSFPPVYRAILETFKNTTSVSFDSFLTYLIYSQLRCFFGVINANLSEG